MRTWQQLPAQVRGAGSLRLGTGRCIPLPPCKPACLHPHSFPRPSPAAFPTSLAAIIQWLDVQKKFAEATAVVYGEALEATESPEGVVAPAPAADAEATAPPAEEAPA